MDVGNGDAGFYDTGEETTGEDTVMIGFYLCMVLAAAFLLLGSLFALAGEHGANWLSGFSLLSKEERARYDRKRMAADQRNAFWRWGGVMLLGVIDNIMNLLNVQTYICTMVTGMIMIGVLYLDKIMMNKRTEKANLE